MKERLIEIPTASGAMETFVAAPSENEPFPAVIIYMDIWGLREELFDVARRVATVGYYCVVPDLFYRQGRIRNEIRNDKNQMISFALLNADQQKLVLAPHGKLSDAMVLEDTLSIIEFLDAGEPVRSAPVGCIGYCMGGRLVLRVAGHFPHRFKVSACLHGSNLVTDRSDSPHLSAAKAEGELYCGFAELDPFASAEVIRTMGDAMRNAKAKYRYELHRAVDHGYALPERDIYNKSAANRDWEIVFAMFRRQLRPSAP